MSGFDPNSQYGDVDHFYENYYSDIIRGQRVGRFLNRTHRSMEKFWTTSDHVGRVLELGAGDGDHIPFVGHSFSEYIQTDIPYPKIPITNEDRVNEEGSSRVILQYADAQNLNFHSNSFDRVVATCLLLHLQDPEKALEEWRRVVVPGGCVTMLVPCEPGLMLRLARTLLTNPKASRQGFKGYRLFNARDHRNHIGSIRQLIRYVYRDDHVKEIRYPFRIPSWNFNFYYIFQIRIAVSK